MRNISNQYVLSRGFSALAELLVMCRYANVRLSL